MAVASRARSRVARTQHIHDIHDIHLHDRRLLTMKTLVNALDIFVRADGAILIILGLLFWAGAADALIPAHMLLGLALVLALWTLAVVAALVGANRWLVGLAFVWGLITPLLGLTQTRLLPFQGHWIIQVLHLLVGLTAIALAQFLARAARRGMQGATTKRVQPSAQ
jgi:VIT1/CCC1 family predicted Fe2+/Mn2+ transporter